jgi:Zn-dependent peptidase ImmA (M78 family)
MDAKELNRKKNEDYEKFLSITNRKPAIFRDIIIESECKFFAVSLFMFSTVFSPGNLYSLCGFQF